MTLHLGRFGALQGPLTQQRFASNLSFDLVEESQQNIRNHVKSDQTWDWDRPGFVGLEIKRNRDARSGGYQKKGLLMTKGEEWWDFRQKVQQPMLKPRALHRCERGCVITWSSVSKPFYFSGILRQSKTSHKILLKNWWDLSYTLSPIKHRTISYLIFTNGPWSQWLT